VSGNWSGQTPEAGVYGTFSVTIDKDGNVTGSFNGNYTGTIAGSIDVNGNLNAVGTASLGGQSIQFNWVGTATLSGTTINVNGTWSGSIASGTFTGTGQTA
jgi:hypothetical protein